MDILAVFTTGLAVGGLSCLVVQGGLLTSLVATREKKDVFVPSRGLRHINIILAFVVAKLFSYIILGFILGSFGGAFQISDIAKIAIQLIAGTYMLFVALSLIIPHAIFRFIAITPPKAVLQEIKKQSKSRNLFAPLLLGGLTVFIPCGATLAMEALAISSGNGVIGALIMGAFTLGTFPLFLGIGLTTDLLGQAFKRRFLQFAALIVFYLGITTVNGSLLLANSPYTLQSVFDLVPFEIHILGSQGASLSNQLIAGEQRVDMNVSSTGYLPSSIQVKKGVPVALHLITQENSGCTTVFKIPSLGISKNLPISGETLISFTPHEVGKYNFTCSTGLLWGTMEVL